MNIRQERAKTLADLGENGEQSKRRAVENRTEMRTIEVIGENCNKKKQYVA